MMQKNIDEFSLSRNNRDSEDYIKKKYSDYQKNDLSLIAEYTEIRTFLISLANKYESSIGELSGITKPMTDKEKAFKKIAEQCKYYAARTHIVQRHHHMILKKLFKFHLLKYFK
jgi:hypothetical protein